MRQRRVAALAFPLPAAHCQEVSAVRAFVGVYLSTHFNLRLLTALFNHLLKLPLAWKFFGKQFLVVARR